MKVLVKKSTLKDIADAIREQDGDNAVIKPVDFPERITNILTGVAPEEIVIHNLGEISSIAPETTLALQVQILPDCAKQVYSVSSSNPAVAYAEQDPDTKIWSVTGVSEGETTLTFTAGKITKTIQTQVVVYHGPVEPTSLAELKQALKSGADILIGAEIPDKYDGNDNPLIVAQNLNSTNNSSYGGAEGVILVRKFVDPTSQAFGTSSVYKGSAIQHFLDTTYYTKCSDAIKDVISDIDVPTYNGSSVEMVRSKWFLMSDTEVFAKVAPQESGITFDYWKTKTGLSEPSTRGQATSGRILKSRFGANNYGWLRPTFINGYVCYIAINGSADYYTPSSAYGVIPACFISKD